MTNHPYAGDPEPTGDQPDGPRPQPVTRPKFAAEPPNPFGQAADPYSSPASPFDSSHNAGASYGGHPSSYGSGYGTGYDPSYGANANPFTGHSSMVPYGYQVPPELSRHSNNLRLNAWLSVFFPFVSIIYFFVDKGKHPLYDKHLRETLNMGLTRLLLGVGASAFSGFFGTMLGIAGFVYFILAILGALDSTREFDAGRESRYKGAIPFTRE